MNARNVVKRIGCHCVSIGILLVLPAFAVNAQTTIRVPADFPTIQAAINAARDGNTVLVAPGIYLENINFLGKAIALVSEDGPATTAIDGNRRDSVVKFTSGEGPVSSLRGFTIRNGSASFGAGIDMLGSSPTIVGNVFDSNAQGGGGFGAGISGFVASPTVQGNVFRNNSCDNQFLSGVVTFVNGSSPEIVNNIFVDNPCRAINMTLPEGPTPLVSNNTIVGNRTGVRVSGQVSAVLQRYRNNIIVGNAIGLEVEFGSPANNPTWTNNLVFGNLNDYVGIADQTGANGNISADPLFVSPTDGDYHLRPGSPAIDAGNSTGAHLPDIDFDGDARILDGNGDGIATVDIGADEFAATASVIPFETLDSRLVIFRGHPGKDQFVAKGFFRLGEETDGINPVADGLVFLLNDTGGKLFEETIPAGAFRNLGPRGWVYQRSDDSPGIRLVRIKPTTRRDGRFDYEVLARSLDLQGADSSPVAISIQIGNDAGSEDLCCRVGPNVLRCR